MDHRIYRLFLAKNAEEAIGILRGLKFKKLPKTQKQLGEAIAVFRDRNTSIECAVFQDRIFYSTGSPVYYLKDAVRIYQILHTHSFSEVPRKVSVNYDKTIQTHETTEDSEGNILDSKPITKIVTRHETHVIDERFIDEFYEIKTRMLGKVNLTSDYYRGEEIE